MSIYPNKYHYFIRACISFTFLITIRLCFAQNYILGQIVNEKGDPIPYVNIGIQNTNIGTISEMDGNFELKIPEKFITEVILFSSIGYQKISIPIKVNIGKMIKIVLKEDILKLNEIVIIDRKIKPKIIKTGKSHSYMSRFMYDTIYSGSAIAQLINSPFDTTFIHWINLGYINGIKDLNLRVKFKSVDRNGQPGKLLLEKQIIYKLDGASKKLFDSLYLFVTEKNFFVEIEPLVLKENRNEIHSIISKTLRESPELIKFNVYGEMLVNSQKLNLKFIRFKISADKGSTTFYRTSSFGKWYPSEELSLEVGISNGTNKRGAKRFRLSKSAKLIQQDKQGSSSIKSYEKEGKMLYSTLANFERYHQKTPFEKAYLHTDKEIYSHGETLWFSAYLLDAASHRYSFLSSILYVDLIGPDNAILSSLPVKISNGVGKGDFLLPDSLKEGFYQIRAYTNYMRNFDSNYFFSKPIKLIGLSQGEDGRPSTLEVKPDVDFQLFPEGGELLLGRVNYIAFRATDEKGLGIELKGEIIDNNGRKVGGFESQHLGMGKFQILPKPGAKYTALFTHSGIDYSVPFPEVIKAGYVLNIRQNNQKTFITIQGSDGVSFDSCYVVGHVRGNIFTVFQAIPGKPFIYTALSNDEIPSGIAHFTLFKAGMPLLERLAFIKNNLGNAHLTISNAENTLKRQNAGFNLLIDGVEAAYLSVSVQKRNMTPNLTTIRNYLLLTSDLSGTIERPDYYFALEENERREALDLLMMTHGWHRFKWPEVLEGQFPSISYYVEKGFSIEGQVVKYFNRGKGEESNLYLTFMENMEFQQETKTQEDGAFWFDGLQIEDTVTVIIQTVDKEIKSKRKKKKNDGEIVKDKGTYIILHDKKGPATSSNILDPFEKKERYRSYLDDVLDINQIAAAYDEELIILDEVVIEGRQDIYNRPYHRENMLYRNPDNRVIMDSIPGSERYTNIFRLIQGRVPGITIAGTYPDQTAIIRGGVAQFLLNGMPVNEILINSIDPQTIEFIDVLKGLRTSAIYGTSNGVIALYTYQGPRGSPDIDPMGFQTFRHDGFYPAREFYVPKYDLMSVEEKIKPDYRTTQYWNPKVIIEDGKGSFSYFTSDDKGDFIIYLEGITNDGRIVKGELEFSVD